MGHLLLEGGAEFGGQMSEPDLRGIDLAGGRDAPIAILPTAAAPDNNHQRAGHNGLRWFESLGASNVDLVLVTDQASANDPSLAGRVRSARFIYLLGGFPHYLAETLKASRVWQAAVEAYREGAVLGGSSAGAMILCEHYYHPQQGKVLPGLNLLPGCCVLPHHNDFGRNWSRHITEHLPGIIQIGIDEQTGILDEPLGKWTVYGAGKVTLYEDERKEIYSKGEAFELNHN